MRDFIETAWFFILVFLRISIVNLFLSTVCCSVLFHNTFDRWSTCRRRLSKEAPFLSSNCLDPISRGRNIWWAKLPSYCFVKLQTVKQISHLCKSRIFHNCLHQIKCKSMSGPNTSNWEIVLMPIFTVLTNSHIGVYMEKTCNASFSLAYLLAKLIRIYKR